MGRTKSQHGQHRKAGIGARRRDVDVRDGSERRPRDAARSRGATRMDRLLAIIAALSILLIGVVLFNIRRAHIRVEYSVSWLGAAVVMLDLSTGALATHLPARVDLDCPDPVVHSGSSVTVVVRREPAPVTK